MKKIPIGLIIKQIMRENNLSAIEAAKNFGVSRQSIYQTFSREKMSLEERREWAKVLNVDVNEFDKRSVIVEGSKMPTNDNDYLMKYIESLEKRIAEQERTITVLLGKSGSVSSAGYSAMVSFFGAIGLIFGYTTLS